MPKIASIGEVMIEIAPTAAEHPNASNSKALSYAGDTYNTAVCLARLGIESRYVTRLGRDPYSNEILHRLKAESVSTEAISLSDSKAPGLYMIHNSPDGEREFFYWRNNSAARELFSNEQLCTELEDSLANCDWVYFSGITLAIISPAARFHLFAMIDRLKSKGVKIAFDSNFRPRLWQNVAEAQAAQKETLLRCDLALLTLDDEEILWGSEGDALNEALARYADLNIGEIVFKRGAEDVVIVNSDGISNVAVPPVTNIVDTTAAGDTFNAGYIAARSKGCSAKEAADEANRCARVIIQHRGGVIAKEVFLKEYNAAKA